MSNSDHDASKRTGLDMKIRSLRSGQPITISNFRPKMFSTEKQTWLPKVWSWLLRAGTLNGWVEFDLGPDFYREQRTTDISSLSDFEKYSIPGVITRFLVLSPWSEEQRLFLGLATEATQPVRRKFRGGISRDANASQRRPDRIERRLIFLAR